MATKTNIIIGLLILTLVSTGAIYVEWSNDARIRVDNDKSTFYVPHEDYPWIWVVAGRELNKLMDGTSNMNRDVGNIKTETIYDENTITIKRTTPYIRGPVIIDTYQFDGRLDSLELFPISHTVEVINGTGYFYKYEVRDLVYDGETFKLDGEQTSQEFGRNMKVTWWEGYRLGWVYKSGSMYVKSEKLTSDYEIFDVRLFDPEEPLEGTWENEYARLTVTPFMDYDWYGDFWHDWEVENKMVPEKCVYIAFLYDKQITKSFVGKYVNESYQVEIPDYSLNEVCEWVEVNQTTECYNETIVSYHNETYYRTVENDITSTFNYQEINPENYNLKSDKTHAYYRYVCIPGETTISGRWNLKTSGEVKWDFVVYGGDLGETTWELCPWENSSRYTHDFDNHDDIDNATTTLNVDTANSRLILGTIPGTLATSTLANWGLDETTGTAILDETGNGSVGTLVGGTFNVTGQKLGASAVDFDGDNDYVWNESTSNLVLTDGDFTASLWYASTQAGITNYMFNLQTGSDNRLFIDHEGGNDRLQLNIVDNLSNSRNIYCVNTTVSDGNWHFVVAKHDSTNSNVTIFYDGVKCDSGGTDGFSDFNICWMFGNGLDGNCNLDLVKDWSGVMDEVTIHDEALTDAKVLELYNAGAGNQYDYSTYSISANYLQSDEITANETIVQVKLIASDIDNITVGFSCDNNTSWGVLTNGSYISCPADGKGFFFNISLDNGTTDYSPTLGDVAFDFIYAEEDEPTFSNAVNDSTDNFKIYSNFTANITISDATAVDYYIFSTNVTGTWANDSAVDISGTEYNASVGKNISLAAGNQTCWYYWANDTYGNTNQSDEYCFIVANTAPVVSSVNITSSDSFNRTNGTLTGSWSFTDVDNNSLLSNETQWYNNSILIVSLNNFESIASGNISVGETWIFSVRSNDGTDWSTWQNSSAFTVKNTAPAITLNAPANNTTVPDRTYALLNVTPTDLDEQEMNVSFYSGETEEEELTTFNDSSSSTNLIFSASESKTVYVSLPENANVTYAVLDLTGYSTSKWIDLNNHYFSAELTNPIGVTAISSTLLAVLTSVNIYYYNFSNLEYVDLNYSLSEATSSHGIEYLGGKLWIGESTDNKIYRYTTGGAYDNFNMDTLAEVFDLTTSCFTSVYLYALNTSGYIEERHISTKAVKQTIDITDIINEEAGGITSDTTRGVIFVSNKTSSGDEVYEINITPVIAGSGSTSLNKSHIVNTWSCNPSSGGFDNQLETVNNPSSTYNSFVNVDGNTNNIYSFYNNYPTTNPYFEAGTPDGQYEFNDTREFTTTNTSLDFSSQLNINLSNCDDNEDGYCDVPLLVHSDTVGKITLNALNITYENTTLLGTDYNVPSGGNATYNWTGLTINTTYTWYTTATDGTDTTTSDLWTFTTAGDTIYPYWSNNGTNATSSTKTGANVYFNVTLTDDVAGGNQIFSFYNGSTWLNDSSASWTTPADLNEERTLTATRGMTVSWYWWFDDSYSNVNETDVWSFVVNNTIPIASSVSISSNDSLNRTNGTLTGSWVYSDADSDPKTDNETQWYKDATEVIDLKNFSSVDHNNLTRGESWIFSVRAYDGYDWSIWVNSSAFIIENAEPEITLNAPANGSINQDLTTMLNATVCDLDRDNVNVAFYQNNTSLLSIVTLRDNLVNTLFDGNSSKILTFSQAGNQSDYFLISDHANVTSSTFSLTGLINYVASLWQTLTQSNFDEGNYSQTFYNTSGFVQLNATYVTGNYTSKIFNANVSRQWNNISWTQGGYYQQGLPSNKAIEGELGGANMTDNIGLWHLNEQSGTNAPDTSGNNANGTLINMDNSNWVSGKLNNALQFDGVDEYVDCGNKFDFERNDSFSIEAWIKTPSSSGTIISRRTGSPSFRGWIVNNVDEHVSFNLANNNFITNRLTMRTVSSFNDNIFHHIVVTYNGTSDSSGVHIYVDGVDEALSTVIDSLTATIKTTADCNIGSYDDGTDIWNGTLDEIAVWNRTLSAIEILDIYKRGALKLNLTVRSCDDSTCSGESWTDINDTSPQNLSVINNTYFQYKYEFETDNISYFPELYNVTVSYTEYYYPTNVTLNIGNDSDLEWNQTGVLNYIATVNDSNTTPTFTSKLNSILENCSCSGCEHDATVETCKIPFVLSSETIGKINISDINITYDLREGDFTYLWSGLLPNTTYGWFVHANDSTAGVNSSIWYFTTWIYPEVFLNAPVNGFVTNISNIVTFNCTANGNYSLVNTSLYLTDASNSSFALNETNSTLSDVHSTDVIFTKTIGEGNYTWSCEACDNQSHCSFAPANFSFTSSYIGLKLDGVDANRSYEYRTMAQITTGANYIDIYDDTGRWRNQVSPFNYTIDLLRENKFNDSTTWKNISSGTQATVQLGGGDELYNTTFNITGIDNPENITLTYFDSYNLFFPGTLVGNDLYQSKVSVLSVLYNSYNITFDSAEYKTIYVNYSNQGDVLNRTGLLNFTITGFDLDTGNNFSFEDNFSDTSSFSGTYSDNLSLYTEIDDFGDNDSSYWSNPNPHRSSIEVINKDYLRMGFSAFSTESVFTDFVDLLPNFDLRKTYQFKTNLSRTYSYSCERNYEDLYAYSNIYLTDGTTDIKLWGTQIFFNCKDFYQSWSGTTNLDIEGRLNSSTDELDIYKNEVYQTTKNIGPLDDSIRPYLKFRSSTLCSQCSGDALYTTYFNLWNISVSGISLKTNNSTYPLTQDNYTSELLFTAPNNIERAILNATVYEPTDTLINYYLSNDNGTTWEFVLNGVYNAFDSTGNELKARFELNNSNVSLSPIVYSYGIDIVPLPLNELNIRVGTKNNLINYSYELNSTTTPVYYYGNDTDLNLYINNSCNETDCLIPIEFLSGSGGIIEISNFNLTENINPITLNSTNIGRGTIINLSSDGHINITNLKFDYDGHKNITVTAHTGSSQINRTISVYYSKLNATIFPDNIYYWDLFPPTPTSKNVEPFGQTGTTPFFLFRSESSRPFDIYLRFWNNTNPSCTVTQGNNESTNIGRYDLHENFTNIGMLNGTAMTTNITIWTWTNFSCSSGITVYEPYFEARALCDQCVHTTDFNETGDW